MEPLCVIYNITTATADDVIVLSDDVNIYLVDLSGVIIILNIVLNWLGKCKYFRPRFFSICCQSFLKLNPDSWVYIRVMCDWYSLPLDVVDDAVLSFQFLVIFFNILNTNCIPTLASRSNQTKGQLNRKKKNVTTVIPNVLKLGSLLVFIFNLRPKYWSLLINSSWNKSHSMLWSVRILFSLLLLLNWNQSEISKNISKLNLNIRVDISSPINSLSRLFQELSNITSVYPVRQL